MQRMGAWNFAGAGLEMSVLDGANDGTGVALEDLGGRNWEGGVVGESGYAVEVEA